MEKEFDKEIKSRLAENAVTPPADLWQRIESKLDAFEHPIEETRTNKFQITTFLRYASAAVVIGVAGFMGFLFLNEQSVTSNVSSSEVSNVSKQDIQIGGTLEPAVLAVEVAEVKTNTKKTSTKSPSLPSSNTVQILASSTTESRFGEHTEETADASLNSIPVYALKLNSPKFSPNINDRIKLLSGEPVNVEVDETLNQKHILIYQRIKLANDEKKMMKNLKGF